MNHSKNPENVHGHSFAEWFFLKTQKMCMDIPLQKFLKGTAILMITKIYMKDLN